MPGGNGTNVPLMPQTLAQLNWLGVDDDSARRMAPYVTLLPTPTSINLNTAPREVLTAVLPGLDLGTAERLVQVRQRHLFKSVADAPVSHPAPAPAVVATARPRPKTRR